MMDMRRLYEEIGHVPIGSCGGCNARILQVLYDHLKEEDKI
jgi:Ni,Fe-hydrogenase III small subunit